MPRGGGVSMWVGRREVGEGTVETVGEDAALDAGVEEFAVDVEAGDVAGGGDVAHGFHGEDHVDGEERQNNRSVYRQLERVDPDKRHSGRGVDGAAVEVAACRSDDAPNEQADDDGGRLHDGRAEALAQDDGEEDGKPQADELGASPGEGVRCVDVRTQLEEAGSRSAGAVVGAAGPVLEARLDEVDADEHDGGTGDQWREDAFEDAWRRKGHEDFDQRADALRAQDGAVAVRTGEFGSVGGGGTEACVVHLREGTGCDGDGRKRRADDADESRSDVVVGAVYVEAGDLNHGEEATDDQRGRD